MAKKWADTLTAEWPPHTLRVPGGGRAFGWVEYMFNVNVCIVACAHDRLEAFLASVGIQKASTGPPPAGKVIEHYKNDNCCSYVVWVSDEWKPTPDGLNTLVHEITHVTMTILMRRGFDADRDHEEPYCYMAGHLFERAYRCLTGKVT